MTTAPGTVDLAALLDGLVRRDGDGLLDDRRRLHGLLRDYAPDSVAEIRLMMAAHDTGLVARLRHAPRPIAPEALARETDTVAAAAGCAPEAARAAVAAWVRAVASGGGSATTDPGPDPLPLPIPTAAPRSGTLRLAGGLAAALAMAAVAARLLGYL